MDTTQRDALLASLVSRLNECVSEADMLAQVNQDRFVVLVRNVERPHSLMLLAKNLMDSITRQLDLETLALRPTASIGISFYQPNAEETMDAKKEAELLLSQASSAMNMAMREGKNQILFFEPRLARKAKERLTKETEIMNALTQGDFSLYLQPQIDLRTGRLAGAEALIRWNRKDGELTLPSEFIPLAEEVGGIEALDEWVISESMKILSAWQKQNIGVPISLNVSGIQIANLSYVELLEKMLREYQLDPHMLHLEVTETAYISNMEQAAEMLARLRKIGIKIALDDFGMGYAGLNYLQHLPVDIIKIDKNFVDQIPADDALVRIVASIADVLALDVVAEGVESHMQCEWLLEHGIYYAQGYWFSPALPQEEFERKYFLI
ncbi:biofilm formation regulator HmsP [Hafnia alvei]|uniref:Biofilm formation regulator HmsP n=1 Tax=Hafnia alvei TaxID=569 RepID=A0A377PPV5_HAFAL|nr:biofilm formation regulator HmsP [Hafnia alvei]